MDIQTHIIWALDEYKRWVRASDVEFSTLADAQIFVDVFLRDKVHVVIPYTLERAIFLREPYYDSAIKAAHESSRRETSSRAS